MRVQGTYRYPAGAARLRPERLPAMKGRAMPVSRVIRVMVGVTITIKRDESMAAGLLPGSVGHSPVRADQRYAARPGGLARGFRHSRRAGSARSARFPGRAVPRRVAGRPARGTWPE